ncbi:MAG: preprotein translocase subunit SecG [Actinomycetota bacterium]
MSNAILAVSNLVNVGVIVVHLLAALFLIIFVLLHSGKGSGLSDMFGGGSSMTGGTSVERRLDQITIITATIFGLTTFWLAWQWK